MMHLTQESKASKRLNNIFGSAKVLKPISFYHRSVKGTDDKHKHKGSADVESKRVVKFAEPRRSSLQNVRNSISFHRAEMSPLFKAADETYIKKKFSNRNLLRSKLDGFQYEQMPFLGEPIAYVPSDVPIVFKVSPDKLINLAANVVDTLPLPSVYKWTTDDVCKWIKAYGYSHFAKTFRTNMITGPKLLLLDASALSAMNIKNFDDIKHITKGIRGLLYFELTRFTRDISLAPEYHYELYKLFRMKTGPRFEEIRRTDLWRQMQLLRELQPYLNHWDMLERWLHLQPSHKYPELFGGLRRDNLYHCEHKQPRSPSSMVQKDITENEDKCECIPPCTCCFGQSQLRPALRFHMFSQNRIFSEPTAFSEEEKSEKCIPPCTCNWPHKFYSPTSHTLKAIEAECPHKYGLHLYDSFIRTTIKDSISKLHILINA